MAKKTTKKAARKAAKKVAKRAGKKTAKKATRKTAKKKSRKKTVSLAPKPIKTGRGASPAEVGAGVVAMVNAGESEKAIWDKWFNRNFVSIEGNMGRAWHGRPAAQAKSDWWYGANTVHSLEADGPYTGATGFAVRYTIDAEEKATGKRWKDSEIAFYTVKNGKVVQEEFMGPPM